MPAVDANAELHNLRFHQESRMRLFSSLVAMFALSIDCNLGDLLRKHDEPAIGSHGSLEDTFNFVSTGLSHLFWSHVASPNFTSNSDVTADCRTSLSAVAAEFLKEINSPVSLIDFSAKRVIRSSPGTHDQCVPIFISIKGASITTKYCVVNLFPVKVGLSDTQESSGSVTRRRITFDRVSYFNQAASIHSLCVPSQCSQVEMKQIISAGESIVHNCRAP